MKTKYCSYCKKLKKLSEFYHRYDTKDTYGFYCKQCDKKYNHTIKQLKYHKKHWLSKKALETHRKWQKTAKGIYRTIKFNSLNNGREFNLSQKQFINWYNKQERICIYCRIHEKDIINNKYYKIKRLTIDRKNNDKGYELNNIVLACDICNKVKSNIFNYKEMLKIGKTIYKIIKEK